MGSASDSLRTAQITDQVQVRRPCHSHHEADRANHGGRVKIRQQWGGDFYCVELCHSLTNGTRLTCVVDPDTFRIKRCQLTLDPAQPGVLVACDQLPLATYDCRTHVLVCGSGGRVTAHD